MSGWHEALMLLCGLAGSAFALARLSLAMQRDLVGRFAGFLEASLSRQEATSERLAQAVAELRHGVDENTLTLRQIAERLAGRASSASPDPSA